MADTNFILLTDRLPDTTYSFFWDTIVNIDFGGIEYRYPKLFSHRLRISFTDYYFRNNRNICKGYTREDFLAFFDSVKGNQDTFLIRCELDYKANRVPESTLFNASGGLVDSRAILQQVNPNNLNEFIFVKRYSHDGIQSYKTLLNIEAVTAVYDQNSNVIPASQYQIVNLLGNTRLIRLPSMPIGITPASFDGTFFYRVRFEKPTIDIHQDAQGLSSIGNFELISHVESEAFILNDSDFPRDMANPGNRNFKLDIQGSTNTIFPQSVNKGRPFQTFTYGYNNENIEAVSTGLKAVRSRSREQTIEVDTKVYSTLNTELILNQFLANKGRLIPFNYNYANTFGNSTGIVRFNNDSLDFSLRRLNNNNPCNGFYEVSGLSFKVFPSVQIPPYFETSNPISLQWRSNVGYSQPNWTSSSDILNGVIPNIQTGVNLTNVGNSVSEAIDIPSLPLQAGISGIQSPTLSQLDKITSFSLLLSVKNYSTVLPDNNHRFTISQTTNGSNRKIDISIFGTYVSVSFMNGSQVINTNIIGVDDFLYSFYGVTLESNGQLSICKWAFTPKQGNNLGNVAGINLVTFKEEFFTINSGVMSQLRTNSPGFRLAMVNPTLTVRSNYIETRINQPFTYSDLLSRAQGVMNATIMSGNPLSNYNSITNVNWNSPPISPPRAAVARAILPINTVQVNGIARKTTLGNLTLTYASAGNVDISNYDYNTFAPFFSNTHVTDSFSAYQTSLFNARFRTNSSSLNILKLNNQDFSPYTASSFHFIVITRCFNSSVGTNYFYIFLDDAYGDNPTSIPRAGFNATNLFTFYSKRNRYDISVRDLNTRRTDAPYRTLIQNGAFNNAVASQSTGELGVYGIYWDLNNPSTLLCYTRHKKSSLGINSLLFDTTEIIVPVSWGTSFRNLVPSVAWDDIPNFSLDVTVPYLEYQINHGVTYTQFKSHLDSITDQL